MTIDRNPLDESPALSEREGMTARTFTEQTGGRIATILPIS